MSWHRQGDKSLSEAMMFSLLTHICVPRPPQWIDSMPNLCSLERHHISVMACENHMKLRFSRKNNEGKTKAQHYWPLVYGFHRRPVDFPNEGTVTQKALPCHNVIMIGKENQGITIRLPIQLCRNLAAKHLQSPAPEWRQTGIYCDDIHQWWDVICNFVGGHIMSLVW